MLTMTERVSVTPVSDDVGTRIRTRRTRLGMAVKVLAEHAGVDRGRLAEIEAGTAKNVRAATLGAITRALDELEAERAGDLPPGVSQVGDPADDLFAIEVYTPAGTIQAIVKGQPKDADLVREQALKLMADLPAMRPPTENGA